jgi:RNA polymerase sigma-70 factor (ECF subfamily)
VSPPKDEVTSLTAVAESAQNDAAGFAITHWSVVLEAQGQSPAAQEALEKLCRTYWRPVYSFIRREGTAPEEAEDLTQSFLLCCCSVGISKTFAKRKDACVLIC